MSTSPVFFDLSSNRIADLICRASSRVLYAAPGIQDGPAVALVKLKERSLPPELTTVTFELPLLMFDTEVIIPVN